MGSNVPATKNDIKKFENQIFDKFAIVEARLERIQTTLSDIQAERENNPTTNPRATSELSGPAGDTVHSGGKQAYHYAAPVTYGDNAQSGGSRDVYNGDVDRNKNKTTYGDKTQVGGYRENKQQTNNLTGPVTGENFHFGFGHVNHTKN